MVRSIAFILIIFLVNVGSIVTSYANGDEFNYLDLVNAIKNQDNISVENILSSKRSLVNKTDRFGYSPIFWAIESKNKKIIYTVLSYNPDLSMRAIQGVSIGISLVVNNVCDSEILTRLDKAGIDYLEEYDGITLLNYAAFFKAENCVRYLLKNGYYRRKVDRDSGNTLLHNSVYGGIEILKLVYKYDSKSINIKNKQGITPLELSRKMPDNRSTFNFLLEKKNKRNKRRNKRENKRGR